MLREDYKKSQGQVQADDLGYLLGWLCGGTLVLGWVVAVVNLVQGRTRRAFQAFVLPLGVVAWLFVVMDGVRPLMPGTEAGNAAWLILLLGGIVLIPLLGLRYLKTVPWPATNGMGSE